MRRELGRLPLPLNSNHSKWLTVDSCAYSEESRNHYKPDCGFGRLKLHQNKVASVWQRHAVRPRNVEKSLCVNGYLDLHLASLVSCSGFFDGDGLCGFGFVLSMRSNTSSSLGGLGGFVMADPVVQIPLAGLLAGDIFLQTKTDEFNIWGGEIRPGDNVDFVKDLLSAVFQASGIQLQMPPPPCRATARTSLQHRLDSIRQRAARQDSDA